VRAIAVIAVIAACVARAQETAPAAPAAPAPMTTDASTTPEEQFTRGKNAFDYADCANAIIILAPLAVPGKLQDEKEQLKVHQMLGVCYALTENRQLDAAREFSSLLSIDPDYDLDAFHNPPAAVDIFTRQRDAMKAQLEELRRAREKAKQSAAEAKGGFVVEKNTLVRDVPLAVAFMPFGLAQGANGETALGVAVGAVQGVTLATTVTTFWASMYYLGLEDTAGTEQVKAAQKSTYTALVVTQWIAALAFAGAYGAGVGEALWNREDRVVIEKKESKRLLTPEEIAALKNVPSAP
jgi:hypothetical protein